MGLQTFLSEGHISYHTTIRGPDILRNEIVARYCSRHIMVFTCMTHNSHLLRINNAK